MTISSVTIIIPTYNGARWIEKAIRSVFAQSFEGFELLIIDDCSKDNTAEIVSAIVKEDARIRFFKNEKNLGVQGTRNYALGLARGGYIAEIDQDDEWIDSDKLKKQIEFLTKNPEYVLIGTGAIMVDDSGEEIARYLMPETDEMIRIKLLRMNCFIHSSVMYRTNIVKEIGGYSIGKLSEDHDLWLRLGRKGKLANLQEYATQYLYSPGGFNSQNKFFRLRQNMLFIQEHKDVYPNALYAYLFGWAKIFFTPIFNLLPSWAKGIFLGIHKKF